MAEAIDNAVINTIYGFDQSEVHGYALAKNISFIKIMANDEKGRFNAIGDANCDESVDLSDVVLIMQSIANPGKYGINGSAPSHITVQGTKNADVIGNDGMTNTDALTIQKFKLKMIQTLPI